MEAILKIKIGMENESVDFVEQETKRIKAMKLKPEQYEEIIANIRKIEKEG
jgi:hypothetical protein